MNVEQLRRLLAGQGNKKSVLINGRPLTREDISITNVVEIVPKPAKPSSVRKKTPPKRKVTPAEPLTDAEGKEKLAKVERIVPQNKLDKE